MPKNKHTGNIYNVINSLNKKNDIKIIPPYIYLLSQMTYSRTESKMIPNPNRKNDLGIGSWGKIDFLLGIGYILITVSNFNNI